MPRKKKTKISNKKFKVAVINQPVKDLAELQKWLENIEVISKFVEKIGNRHNVRTKLVEILFSYLSKIKLHISVPKEKEFHLNLMKILGFCLLYFFISISVLLNLLFSYVNLFNRFTHWL
jgi:hypothetical protein